MARKKYNEKRFAITRNVFVNCWTEDTSYGFRHLSELSKNGYFETSAKATYQNRTWESYEYESVLKKLLEITIKSVQLTDYAIRKFKQMVKDPNHKKDDTKQLKQVANIAKLGEFFGSTKKEKNDWKLRMLKAGITGLDIPEGFEDLSEDEQERRLNATIQAAGYK